MKKILAAALALLMALGLCACGDESAGNGLFAAASPEDSALMLYICEDGESVRRLMMHDSGDKREIFDALAAVSAKPAKRWTARDAAMPVYAVWTGRNDGEPGPFELAWSNGYLITPDGAAYKFDFDFAALETAYDWNGRAETLPIGRLPCSRVLAQDGEGWIRSMLTPAEEPEAPEGISMTLDSIQPGEIAVTFTNDSGERWQYGEFYDLEVMLDGAWYEVPAWTEMDFYAVAYLLHAGESQQKSYNTQAYGELPAGRYRIVVEYLTAEFELGAVPHSEGAGNELFAAADPEGSVLELFVCEDGENVRMLSMYETETEQEILDKLARVTAKPAARWTPRDVTMPVYGIETGKSDGGLGSFELAWSDGYLITPDGSAYEFDFDFGALEGDYRWRDCVEGFAIIRLPCSHALSLCGDEWISSMLTPAQELSPPRGISMTFDSVEGDAINVTLHNDRNAFPNARPGDRRGEWRYGRFYHIEVLLDGRWYILPSFDGYCVNAMAYRLPAGESRQESYWMEPYGELPAGHYRLVTMGLTAEFELA